MNLRAKNIKFFLYYTWQRFKKSKGIWKQYSRSIKYIHKTQGLEAAYNFVWAHFFIKEMSPAFINPVYSVFPELASYPKQLELEITTRCHLRCRMCEHTHWKEQSEDLSFDNFIKIIDQFPHLKWCNPTGEGSAFLNKDYIKMLQYLKDKKVTVEFVESFDQINEDLSRQLIKMGINRIWVSFDAATKETYEKIKVGTKFERTIENLKTFIRVKKELSSPIPELCFRYILMNDNVGEVLQYLDLIRSLGTNEELGDGFYVEYAGLLEFDANKQFNAPELSDEITSKIQKRAKELGIPVGFAHYTPDKLRPRHHCAAWIQPYITIDGYVISCCAILMSNRRDYLREHSFGNAFTTPFKDIWYSKKYRQFRKDVPNIFSPVPALCKDCRVTKMKGMPNQCEYKDESNYSREN